MSSIVTSGNFATQYWGRMGSSDIFTACGWANSSSFPAGDRHIFNCLDTSGDNNVNISWGRTTITGVPFIAINSAVSSAQTKTAFGSSPAANTWFFWAITNSFGAGSGNCVGYWAALGDSSLNSVSTASNSGTLGANQFVYSNGYNGLAWRGKWCYGKYWSGVELSAAQLLREMKTIRPLDNYGTLGGQWSPGYPGERTKQYPLPVVNPGGYATMTEDPTIADSDQPPGISFQAQHEPQIIRTQ